MNLRQIRENFSPHRVQAGVQDVARRALSKMMNLKVLHCLELTLAEVSKEFLLPHSDFDHGFLGERALIDYAAEPRYELDVPFLRWSLSRGDRCYGIVHKDSGALAGYGWYSKHPTDMSDELRFHFDAQDVYLYKGFTAPEFRGRRLHAVGKALALQAYTAEGTRSIVSCVDSNNFPSLRSCYRLGHRDVGTISIVRPRERYHVWSLGRCRERGIWVEAHGHGVS